MRSPLLAALLVACSTSSPSSSPSTSTANNTADASAPSDGGGGGGGGGGFDPWGSPAVRPNGAPVENEPPNASGQTPAFTEQTRAPGHPTNVAFDVKVVASGLDHPWAVVFLPDGTKLVTERPGRLRLVNASGTLSAALGGVPAVFAEGQGGLLDIALDPAFGQNQLVYFSYAEPRENGASGTAVARGRLVQNENRIDGATVIWRMKDSRVSGVHFGCRLAFSREGDLFITAGERGVGPGNGGAQDTATEYGKVVRVRPDGSGSEIFSIGHRNPQAAAIHPKTGELWAIEHGARGGDEINVVRAGKNYGWPIVTYGIDYSGASIGEGVTAKDGIEQPVYYWDPVIAPSGMTFYDGAAFPAWRGSLFVGALAGQHLARLTLDGEKVIGEERLLADRAHRIRDVRTTPQGTLLLLDDSSGELLELAPR